MQKRLDIIGKRFGRLVVLKVDGAVRVSFNLGCGIIISFLDDYYPELVEVFYPSSKNLVDNFVEGGLC